MTMPNRFIAAKALVLNGRVAERRRFGSHGSTERVLPLSLVTKG
jgi:hypothetical protein